jgi:hypothetical protein
VITDKSKSVTGGQWKARAWLFATGISAVLSLNALTGLIVEPGRWYSDSLALRRQTDAFFHGAFALSRSPLDLYYDLVWDGGVQQVWGLGVPAFRFVFEALARVFGFAAFPDRVVFLIGWLLCFMHLAGTLAPRDGGVVTRRRGLAIAAVMILMLGSAPFVTLVSTRFEVYEEVAAYSHLCGVALFAGLLGAARRPAAGRLAWLAAAAGLAAFVRPTLAFYGGVTLACALFIGWRARVSAKVLGGMAALFSTGVALLCLSNWTRFGAAAEFGHTLNLTDLEMNTYALKFGCPFDREPLISALKDEAGSMFFVRELNGRDWYRTGCVLGQSSTFRWHELYFTGFDGVWLALFAGSAAFWLGGRARRAKGRCGGSDDLAPRREDGARSLDEAFALVAAPWSLGACALLFTFYLRSPSISSRYMLDFLPALTAGISALAWRLATIQWPGRPLIWPGLVFGAVVVWTVAGIKSAEIEPQYRKRISLDVAATARKPRPSFSLGAMPPEYAKGLRDSAARIPFNTVGWNMETGESEPAVILWASSPECVKIELFNPDTGPITREQLGAIRAKIGLEFLERESEGREGSRAEIVFSGPRRGRYKRGLQVCFIGMVSPADLGQKAPGLRIARVSFSRSPKFPGSGMASAQHSSP